MDTPSELAGDYFSFVPFFSAAIKSVDTLVVALAKKIPGIAVLSGNNFTVSVMHSSLVLEM